MEPTPPNEILNNLDLFRSIVSKKIKLNQYDRGLCPFHEEETPSFSIYLGHDRARYHCFGCGSTGDIINYIQRTEHLNFNTAVMKLKLYIRNQGAGIYSLPTEPLAELAVRELTTQQQLDELIYKYNKLEELYIIVWEENQKFRVWLNLGNYHPSIKNRIEYIYREEENQMR